MKKLKRDFFITTVSRLTSLMLSTVIQYMDKPPKGKHSTKGLGKKKPEESDYVKWRDDVTVPCGKPVDSHVRASELMYNEYIVYDTAQVSSALFLFLRREKWQLFTLHVYKLLT